MFHIGSSIWLVGSMKKFLGLPDDVARLALQRLLQCDVRCRSHRNAASFWQRTAIVLGIATAVLSSLAAFSAATNSNEAAIFLSVAVAVLAPLQSALAANDRMERHRSSATTYELLANDLDRYINLELGPPMWRKLTDDLEDLPKTLSEIDEKIEKVASIALSVRIPDSCVKSSLERGSKIVEYLRMKNVQIPPREIWID